MSVDYGNARTGLAICDKGELLASPVGVIKETYMPKVAKAVAEKALELKAELLVVGCPINMDGSFGERAKVCTELADLLKDEFGINTTTWDERMTTVIAHKNLNETNTRGKKTQGSS